MKKKYLLIKSICSFALAVTLLFSYEFTAFARPATDITTTTSPLDKYAIENGWLSLELVTNTTADKSEYFFSSDSTIKLNCIDANHLPKSTGTTLGVVIFYPDSTMNQRGIASENLIPFDIYDENSNIINDVYVHTTPYSFGDTFKIVTPELIESVNKYGSGTLLMGISGGGAGFEISDGRYLQWSSVTPNDFILDDYQPVSTETPTPNALPSEIQETEQESISAEPTNNTDAFYTVAKYDTLGVIALNYYGSYEANKQLYEVNKDILKQNNYKLNEGTQLRLPSVLGNYTLITPPQITGNEKLYSIKVGDTLRSIAQNVYGDSSLYQTIFDRNKDRIKNVNQIYEGLIIVCP